MPRTAVTVTQITRAASGIARPAAQNDDQTNGMTLAGNDGRIIIEFNVPGGVGRTATFAIPATADSVASPGKVITVGAGATVLVGPFPTSIYNQSDGSVNIDFNGANSEVTLRTYQLSPL